MVEWSVGRAPGLREGYGLRGARRVYRLPDLR